MLDENVLVAEDVVVTRGDDRVLDEASLTVAETEAVLVQGTSGAGKSTLFSVLGLLERPDQGSVLIDGKETTSLSERECAEVRRETVGTIFQDFKLIEDLTARENVAVPMEHTGAVDEAWLSELFERLGITSIADRRPPTLSGGEKQRVAIARALANRPTVLLADEPTGQLDPETTADVMDVLFSCREAFDTALLVVSHDPGITESFERVVQLEDGMIVEGSPALDSQST